MVNFNSPKQKIISISEFEGPNNQHDSDQYSDKFKFSWKQLWKSMGPGLLISIAYLDPGNLSGDMDAGLNARYGLLWALLYSTILGWVFQIYALILGIATGRDMASLCREHYGKKTSYFLWIMAEIAIIGSDIQEVLGSAIALNILFGLRLWLGVLITISNTLLILLIKAYGMRLLEGIFAGFIGIMAVCFFINLNHVHPQFAEIMQGIIVPQVSQDSKLALVGLVGSVLMPHNLYLHSSLVNEVEILKNNYNASRANSASLRNKERMVYNSIETGISLFISFLINAAVICTFAHYQGEDIDLQSAAFIFYKQFGSTAKYIWGIGLLAAGQSSTLTGTLAGQYIMEGFIKLKISKFKRALFTRSIAIIPTFMIAFTYNNSNFNGYLNMLQAVQLPFAVIPLLRFCSNQQIMKKYKISKLSLGLLIFFSTLVIGMNYYGSIPDKIDWSNYQVYISLALIIAYFSFMAVIIFMKFPIEEILSSEKEIPQQIYPLKVLSRRTIWEKTNQLARKN